MKLDQLRKIIREEVRAAVKEELQDILNEAVKVASTPGDGMTAVPKGQKKKWSVGKSATLDEMLGNQKPKSTNIKFSNNKNIQSMLEQTRQSMTNEDYQQVYAGDSSMVKKPNFASSVANNMGMGGNQPGLDISQLDFVKKAKSVLDASYAKDKR
jgi:hypothetical protein|tara:strand:- start:4828 stop:5292 length:465 start_codon:yes stop_codon:yes gene_type:complete